MILVHDLDLPIPSVGNSDKQSDTDTAGGVRWGGLASIIPLSQCYDRQWHCCEDTTSRSFARYFYDTRSVNAATPLTNGVNGFAQTNGQSSPSKRPIYSQQARLLYQHPRREKTILMIHTGASSLSTLTFSTSSTQTSLNGHCSIHLASLSTLLSRRAQTWAWQANGCQR
jgi:hypothetical protein